MDDEALLSLATAIAAEAGRIIMAVRARGFTTKYKPDESPVTEADHAAEAMIAAALRQATPGILVIAEEEVATGLQHEPDGDYWLVDPLDGTREFTAGTDDFTVNIGLVRQGRPVIGAVDVPARGELFGGLVRTDGRPNIAWKRDADGEYPIRARMAPAEGLTVVASRHYADDEQLKAFLARYKVVSLANYGSGLKILRVAEGAADLYPRMGRTIEWDTAAPQAVLEAAGGRMTTMDGSPFRYGKPLWANDPFICLGAG